MEKLLSRNRNWMNVYRLWQGHLSEVSGWNKTASNLLIFGGFFHLVPTGTRTAIIHQRLMRTDCSGLKQFSQVTPSYSFDINSWFEMVGSTSKKGWMKWVINCPYGRSHSQNASSIILGFALIIARGIGFQGKINLRHGTIIGPAHEIRLFIYLARELPGSNSKCDFNRMEQVTTQIITNDIYKCSIKKHPGPSESYFMGEVWDELGSIMDKNMWMINGHSILIHGYMVNKVSRITLNGRRKTAEWLKIIEWLD